jgi:deoxycytidylate deaminase
MLDQIRPHGLDSNDQRKREILTELIRAIRPDADVDAVIADPLVEDSQFMDALEYGRIVHAEMSAISDAARLGLPIKGGTLHCTTFPCHMCAKHIIAAGIERVVFLEPYPKSLAFDLHADALLVEGGDRGRYRDFPAVTFEHFYGVTPRRYSDLFGRISRKSRDGGKLVPYAGKSGKPTPYIDIKFPFYSSLEGEIIAKAPDTLTNGTFDT